LLVPAGCGSGNDVLYVGAARPSSLEGACTPDVEVQILEPASGRIFSEMASDPRAFVQELTKKICPILYRSADEVPGVPKITLVFAQTLSSPGTNAQTDHLTTTVSGPFLTAYASNHTVAQTQYELTGLLVDHFSSIYQRYGIATPIQVRQGVNEFVRYRVGYLPLAARTKGGNWNDGSQTTGFFFDYLDRRFTDFVYRLNGAIGYRYDVALFEDMTHENVEQLWVEYQASF
jgi:hypothetical protein